MSDANSGAEVYERAGQQKMDDCSCGHRSPRVS